MPDNLPIAKLKLLDHQYVRSVLDRFNIQLPEDVTPSGDAMFGNGFIITVGDEIRASFGEDGSYEINLATPSRSSTKRISENRVKSIAFETVRTFGLDRDVTLVLDGISHEFEKGQRSGSASSEISGPQSTQTHVLFKQVINGLRVLTPGTGELKISIDNEGSVLKVASSTRQIKEFIRRIGKTTVAPPEDYLNITPKTQSETRFEKMLDDEARKLLASWIAQGQAPIQVAFVPGSMEIGYEIHGDDAVPGARRIIDVDFGDGYRKRYWIKVVAYRLINGSYY